MTCRTAPLFILSPDDCDTLCAAAGNLGWRPVGHDRAEGAEERFLASEARVLLLDLRDARLDRDALAPLLRTARCVGAAAIALCSPAEIDQADRLLLPGVTHFLIDPLDAPRLRLALHGAFAVAGRLDAVRGLVPPAGPDSDRLTGVASRGAALDWMTHAQGQTGSVPLCLLVGISQFDAINAAYGQALGDEILARVAGRIARQAGDIVGRDGIVARTSGTEFLVGLRIAREGRDRTGEHALQLARAIVAHLGEPFAAGRQRVRLTVRCGIAEGMDADDSGRLLRRASAALAEARRSDAGDICLRTNDRRDAGIDLDRLDADLRLAVEHGEIGIVFQPQYEVRNDILVGVEALARWDHPRLGRLGAAMLFDAAERSDYLLPLSRHIQREALTQAACWPKNLAHLRLSLNVTATDLVQNDFVGHFLDMVEQSGFPPDRLTVEITESGLIENIADAARMLGDLRGRGMRIALDDFGTGYSSLSYLKGLDLDYLKIDSGLTRDMEGAPRDRVIVRAIIAMARALSIQVIAEGIESESQRELLAQEGCDLYQGFLRSAAVSTDRLTELAPA